MGDGQVAHGEDHGELRTVLRGSFGCSEGNFLKLTADERDRCARWIQAHVDTSRELPADIDPAKRAWFDAALAAYNSPGHTPGIGCALSLRKLSKKDMPTHSLKLGPLPCFVVPPRAS